MADWNKSNIIKGLLVAIGLAVAGWFIGHGFVKSRTGDRYVTVKGVSERDVMADMALWPIRFVSAGNNLDAVQQKIQHDRNRIQSFLEKYNITSDAVEIQNLEVTDRTAQSYQSGDYQNRFILAQTLLVRSEDVTAIDKASQDIGSLVEAGVILNSQYSGSGPTYLFNKLTELKPEMIAEATKNARQSAKQFARDSGSNLNGIRRANQGYLLFWPGIRHPCFRKKNRSVRRCGWSQQSITISTINLGRPLDRTTQ